MQPVESNYKIHDKLIIVEALTKWKQYLLDAIEKFKVWTDYEILDISGNHINLMDNK